MPTKLHVYKATRCTTSGSLLPGTQDALNWIDPGQSSSHLTEHMMGGNAWAKLVTSTLLFIAYIVFIIIFAIALATLIIDLVYPLLDPRIRYRST